MNKSDHISQEKYNYVGLPYFESLTNKVSRILRKFNIGIYTYAYRTIRNILTKLKDFVDAIYERGTIYKIPCKGCSGVLYILVKRPGALALAYLSINAI